MEPWLAFLGALLGAVLGASVTLYADRKSREEADRLRYSPENRELFREFLRMCDERSAAVRKQVEAAYRWSIDGLTVIPTLGPTDSLEQHLHRIEDVIPEDKLSRQAARFLFLNVAALGYYSHKSGREPINPLTDKDWKRDLHMYDQAVEVVRRAYLVEVGAVPRPKPSLQARWRMLRRRVSGQK